MKALVVAMLLPALSCAGCSTEQAYGTAQAWQRNQCNRLPDQAEFDRCMSKANARYEAYQRQRDAEKK